MAAPSGRGSPVGRVWMLRPCCRPWLARRARANARPSGGNDVARRARVDDVSSNVAPSGRTSDAIVRVYERMRLRVETMMPITIVLPLVPITM
eukprot:3081572-Prymnesium_polylepis.1